MGGGKERKSYPTSEDCRKLLQPRALSPQICCECPLPSPAPPMDLLFLQTEGSLVGGGGGGGP